MIKLISLLILCFHFSASLAQESIDTLALKIRLHAIRDRDQKTRTGRDSAAYVGLIDSMNLVEIEALIKKFGWPGKSFVGPEGNNTVFLVVQHAGLETQKKYFGMMKASVESNESRASDLALLEDRILMRENKKQKFGSQVVINKHTGAQEFWPIEDEVHVNERREKAGLEPLESYAKYFGINYILPAK